MGRPLPSSLRAYTLRRHGHAFSLISLPSLELELCRRLCENVCLRFEAALAAQPAALAEAQRAAQSSAQASSRRWSLRRKPEQAPSGVDEQFVTSFVSELKQLLQSHASPERLARYRRVAEIEAVVEDTTEIARENVGRLLSNQENLTLLEDKSTWMLAQTKTFRRRAREVRRGQCWSNMKLNLIIGMLLLAGLGTGALYILGATGVIPWPPWHPGNLTRAEYA